MVEGIDEGTDEEMDQGMDKWWTKEYIYHPLLCLYSWTIFNNCQAE